MHLPKMLDSQNAAPALAAGQHKNYVALGILMDEANWMIQY